MHVSSRSQVAPFHVMELIAAATRRQEIHGDALLLCVGQPSTAAPQVVLRSVERALREQTLGYTPTVGIRPLREAVARHYGEWYDVDVDPDSVVISTGSSGGFSTICLAAFDPGDVVAMTRPGYPAYRNTLQALGCTVLDLECGPQTRFQPSVAQLEALPERPAGLIVASPANPTGTVIDPNELAALADWCAAHDVLLLSDEIYHGLSFGRQCATAWQFSRDAVVMGSVSKYWSMTGWRVGWNLLPPRLARAVDLLQGNLAICAPAVSQVAAVSALGPDARTELDLHVARYARNREVVLERLPELGVTSFAPPDGAFYAWCDIGHLTSDSQRWCHEVLARTGVALAPGIDFDPVDGHRFMRLSFCGSTEDLHEAFDRLRAFLG
ncbi:aminotransferase class I/II-fold pyridoxal phosphate-dependent enzyme [Calidifontibacter sp. DB0510]|uniref:Aminotransferase n=2 Tax=Metallococcus carri TaxID=1656884 RepID=A0A967B3M2_9MICO|nr:aminotransferase class I/II-fold pyridoxal phosphate-dependent enzyme [Metallococcus carri]NOP37393.1 aminotransferase class I/II-fold pyridoxal phosphate-dependent enzyme [Calidifontibacter sp. DB2511S]